MTKRELDQTKNELVRALRRRAAELDAKETQLALATIGARPGPRQPTDRSGRRVAFYARETFQLAVFSRPAVGALDQVGAK